MKGLIDSTLREGTQAVGVNLTRSQKNDIIYALGKIGIEEMELGISTRVDKDLPYLISFCRKKNPNTSISLWSRCLTGDISAAAKFRPDILSISIPTSDLHIKKKFKKTREWVLKRLIESISFAFKIGISKISVGFEDATRADIHFLKELTKAAHNTGAFRVRIADTVGVASPAQITSIIQSIKRSSSIEVGVHTHNDFGMASANAIAALESGADWADVASLGLGERTGCARLEEVVGFLTLNKGRDYSVSQIPKLSRIVAQYSNRPVSPHHPIIGSKIFTCETGLHLLGLEEDPQTYEPYRPEHVGAKRQLIYGEKIGRKNLRHRLAKLNSSVSLTKIDQLFSCVRKEAKKLGRPLSDAELLSAACQK